MKKRIFIAAHYLEIGGAEISLIGLLNAIDYTKYQVDLFLYSHEGELLTLIPKEVNLLPEIPVCAAIEAPIRSVFKKGYVKLGFQRVCAKIKYLRWRKINNNDSLEAYYQFLDDEIIKSLPSLYNLGVYDLAINYIGLKNFIPHKVNAKKTLTWIHTDYTSVQVDTALELPSWSKYDNIISISDKVSESFIKTFPTLKMKLVKIENIISAQYILNNSNAFDAKKEFLAFGDGITLLSIGRFCKAKNYDNVPLICKYLIDRGINVQWFLIGFGIDENLIKEKIKEAGMEKHVIILGKRTNPYPYIKACDIYIQPSRYEGKSIVVREAQMLNKPVVITNYTTASSQINDGIDGVIVPMDNKGCADGIANLISDKVKQQQLIENCTKSDFSNQEEVQKLYKLI